jgi:hypothetical protein
MRNVTLLLSLCAMVALVTTACGTNTTPTSSKLLSSDAAATVSDDQSGGSGVVSDTAGTGASDAGSSGAADTGAAAADTTGQQAKDTQSGTVDAGTPAPSKKCAQTDQMCLQSCVMDKCKDEAGKCQLDTDCQKLVQCLGDCQSGKPVNLPGAATHTCADKCNNAYKGSLETMTASQICVQSSCIDLPYTTPCSQNNPQCVSFCMFDLCEADVIKCIKDPGCLSMFTCMNTEPACKVAATQQACLEGCMKNIADKLGIAAAQTAQNMTQSMLTCGQSKCL